MYNTIQKTKFSNVFEEGAPKTYLQATNEKKDAAVRMKFHYVPKEEANAHNVVRKIRISDFIEKGTTKAYWQAGKNGTVRKVFCYVPEKEINEMDEFAESRERFEPIIAGMRDALDQINVRLLDPDISDEERMALRKARRRYCEKIKYFLATDMTDIFMEYSGKNEYLKGALSQMSEEDPKREEYEEERMFACVVLALCIC